MKFLEIHAIRTLPPQAANRDEDGRPKSVRYGGVERARLSSQAQKRALRLAFRELGLLPPEERAWRTRRLFGLLQERLPEVPEDLLEGAFRGLVKAMGAATKGRDLEYLWFLAEPEVARMADLIRRHGEALARLGEEEEGEEEEERKGGKKPRKKAASKGDLPPEVLEGVAGLLSAPSLEVALFGRMLSDTALAYGEVDGALAVAHALGVGADPFEVDYFVAVDDHEGGAGHLQHAEFAPTTLYQYLVLDLSALARTVGKERALLGAEAVLRAFPHALPRGKERAFAHRVEPEAVVVRLGEGAPRNGAVLYRDPVEPPKVAEKAMERLAWGLARMAEVYGEAVGEWRGGVALWPLEGLPLEGFSRYGELVGSALKRAASLLEG